MLFLAATHQFHVGGVVVLRLLLVAKAAGPCQQRTYRNAVLPDFGFCVDDVGFVEAEGLGNVVPALRILEGEGLRGEQGARGRGHEERLRQIARERLVVGVQGQWVAEPLRCLPMHQVQRSAVTVLLPFQHPRPHLAALAAEGDAVELVFDDGGLLRRADDRRGGRRLLHCLGIEALLRAGGRGWPGCGAVRSGGGMLRRRLLQRLRFLPAVQLEDREYHDHGQHDVEHHAVVIAAAALIGIANLCQVLPLLRRCSSPPRPSTSAPRRRKYGHFPW